MNWKVMNRNGVWLTTEYALNAKDAVERSKRKGYRASKAIPL